MTYADQEIRAIFKRICCKFDTFMEIAHGIAASQKRMNDRMKASTEAALARERARRSAAPTKSARK